MRKEDRESQKPKHKKREEAQIEERQREKERKSDGAQRRWEEEAKEECGREVANYSPELQRALCAAQS